MRTNTARADDAGDAERMAVRKGMRSRRLCTLFVSAAASSGLVGWLASCSGGEIAPGSSDAGDAGTSVDVTLDIGAEVTGEAGAADATREASSVDVLQGDGDILTDGSLGDCTWDEYPDASRTFSTRPLAVLSPSTRPGAPWTASPSFPGAAPGASHS